VKKLDCSGLSWVHIRQSLSLSLVCGVPLRLSDGAAFLAENPSYGPVFSEMCQVTCDLGAGSLHIEGSDITISPLKPSFGVRKIHSGEFSSLSELVLFLLPVLSRGSFRSILNLKGVTHGPLSLPTTMLKETLFGLLANTGIFASLRLSRFGFYGSGEGSAEVRVYPAEKKAADGWVPLSRSITGAKIFVAHMNREIAFQQRSVIQDELGLSENRVAIIEVMDAAGYGNSVQVFMEGSLNAEPLTVVLSREMDVYDMSGTIVFDLERSLDRVKELTDECSIFLEKGTFPETVISELLPFVALAGAELPDTPDSSLLAGTKKVIDTLL